MTPAPTIRRNWHLPAGGRLPRGEVALFDLDGVLADAQHRQRFLHLAEPDWTGFYGAVHLDGVVPLGLRTLAAMRDDLPIVILTGRIDAVAPVTVDWLVAHRVRWDMLVCRPAADSDDSTHAVDYKRIEVRALLDAGVEPILAVDDNRKIVAMYEEFGIPSLYFASGYYDDSARYDGGV